MKFFITFLLLAVATMTARADYDEEVGLQYFEQKNYKMALPMLQRAAKAGSLSALNALGEMYENGWGVPTDKTIMMNMYTKAVARDYIPAIQNLASYYYWEDKLDKAIDLWKRGANLGSGFCMMKLGRCHELGVGMAKDLNLAEELYHKATLTSSSYLEDLASLYYVKGDYKKAFDIYWNLYTTGGYLSPVGAMELVKLLASDNSIDYRNPCQKVTNAKTSPIDVARELNLAKAAQVWLRVVLPQEIPSGLHSMTSVAIDPEKELESVPEVKERLREHELAAETVKGWTEVFPMSQLKRYPEMRGGDEVMADWLCYNLRYPSEDYAKKTSGRVVVAGVVGYDGKLRNLTVIKSATPEMDREALRLTKLMPEFNPGGMTANCMSSFAIPINFNPDTSAPWRQTMKLAASGDNGDEICANPDVSAQFPGGEQALYAWLGENIRYPSMAQINKVQGRVILQFIVNASGDIKDVKIVRGRDRDLDIEAIRVVTKMPRWNPAQYNGKNVSTRVNLPITFKL